ncbi:unnamed protein product, partial [Brassica rapa subsp. trilocularis]
ETYLYKDGEKQTPASTSVSSNREIESEDPTNHQEGPDSTLSLRFAPPGTFQIYVENREGFQLKPRT